MKKSNPPTPKKAVHADKKAALLQAFLTQVPFDGWSKRSFDTAIASLGLKENDVDSLFPAGLVSVAQFFGESVDTAMLTCIKAERRFKQFRVRDKVAFSVKARLAFLSPHREAMRRLLYWYAHPMHSLEAIKRTATTVDLIWQQAGDDSTDFNHYSKRLLLAGVLQATLLFWLGDDSPNNQKTDAFLERRIADVLRFGKSLSLLKEFGPSEIGDFIRRKLVRL